MRRRIYVTAPLNEDSREKRFRSAQGFSYQVFELTLSHAGQAFIIGPKVLALSLVVTPDVALYLSSQSHHNGICFLEDPSELTGRTF